MFDFASLDPIRRHEAFVGPQEPLDKRLNLEAVKRIKKRIAAESIQMEKNQGISNILSGLQIRAEKLQALSADKFVKQVVKKI